MRNKSRKVTKTKNRKTKRRAKLRRAIRGGGEQRGHIENAAQPVALAKTGELNQAGALKKTAALEKMKAIKKSLEYKSTGLLSSASPYQSLHQDYRQNMGKYFEESGSYALMDRIIENGYTDDVSNPTVVFVGGTNEGNKKKNS